MDDKSREALEKALPLLAKIVWDEYKGVIIEKLVASFQKSDNRIDDYLIPLLKRLEG